MSVKFSIDNLQVDKVRIFELIQWQAKHNLLTQLNPQVQAEKLEGFLRGNIAERVSNALQPALCDTVYNPSRFDMGQVKSTTFAKRWGVGTKEGVLAIAVKKSLTQHPLTINLDYMEELPEAEKQTLLADFNAEIVAGYTAGPNRKYENDKGGIFFEETVIPDEVLIDRKRKPVGFVEVKAYKQPEFNLMLENLAAQRAAGNLTQPFVEVNVGNISMVLGAKLGKETKFIDTIREVGYDLPALGNIMPGILRVLEDIPLDMAITYGSVARDLGYRGIVIQRLPVTTKQVQGKVVSLIESNMEAIKTNSVGLKKPFSPQEIQLLEDLVKK